MQSRSARPRCISNPHQLWRISIRSLLCFFPTARLIADVAEDGGGGVSLFFLGVGGTLGLAVARAVVYFRIQFITAAMIGRGLLCKPTTDAVRLNVYSAPVQ